MQKYDKIYVNYHPSQNPPDCRLKEGSPLTKIENVIVCSIEELREMWEECRDETWQDARPTTKYEKPDRLPGFEGYLTSKGIQLNEK